MPHQDEQRVRERAYAIWETEGRPEGGAERHWHQAHAEEKHQTHDEALDAAIDDSFPASDPPAITQPAPSKADKT